jgi:hypothetical protein
MRARLLKSIPTWTPSCPGVIYETVGHVLFGLGLPEHIDVTARVRFDPAGFDIDDIEVESTMPEA